MRDFPIRKIFLNDSKGANLKPLYGWNNLQPTTKNVWTTSSKMCRGRGWRLYKCIKIFQYQLDFFPTWTFENQNLNALSEKKLVGKKWQNFRQEMKIFTNQWISFTDKYLFPTNCHASFCQKFKSHSAIIKTVDKNFLGA